MTPSIALVLGILTIAVLLFVSERLSFDLVALLVLLSLVLTGLLSGEQALGGFSDPAVITVAAVLVLSGGLSRTGVADIVGRYVLRFAGGSDVRLLIVVMTTGGVLSGVMNNIGVAALMLPVVVDIARRTGRAPSKLLMPLAFGSLLGGLTTLIGTSTNILVSGALLDRGLRPFTLFDFTPIGAIALVLGVSYMVLLGRRMLPESDVTRDAGHPQSADLQRVYELPKRLIGFALSEDSELAGETLADSHLGSALGLNVLAITRAGKTRLAPGPDAVLRGGDRLLVEGRLDEFNSLRGWKHLVLESDRLGVQQLRATEIDFAEVSLKTDAGAVGKSLREYGFRRRFGVNVLGLIRGAEVHLSGLLEEKMQTGDTLLVQGPRRNVERLDQDREFDAFRLLSSDGVASRYRLHERLIEVRIPEGSILTGKILAESRLGDAFGLTVLGIVRRGQSQLMPDAGEEFQEGDRLLVQGDPADLFTLAGLQSLEVDSGAGQQLPELESDNVGMAEVMLSAHSRLGGNTLRDLYFRERYGLMVLAIWREGRAYRSNLRDMAIRLGDALLVYGEREKLILLARDPEFLVLTEASQEALNKDKAPVATAIELGVLGAVASGWQPISIAAPTGAAAMVLSGCLTMQEAYRFVEWRAVLLIAGMLSMGVAMQESGATQLLATTVINGASTLGPLAIVASIFLITAAAAQLMPTAAVAVLMAPIALTAAAEAGVSPHSLAMVVAVACSSAFLSPVGHPVNLLVMGLGGYRFIDYTKVGLPLALLMFLIALLVVPFLWPLVQP